MTELFFLPPPAVGEAKLKGGLILPQGTTFFSYEIVPAFSPSLRPVTESLQTRARTDPSCWHSCEIRLVGSGPLWSARRWRSLLLAFLQDNIRHLTQDVPRVLELGLFSLEKRKLRGNLIVPFQYWRELISRRGSNFFTWPDDDRTRGNGFELKEGRFRSDVRKKFFTQKVVRPWHCCPEGVWMPHPWRCSRPGWMSAGQPELVWGNQPMAGGGSLISDPFQPKTFYDSMTSRQKCYVNWLTRSLCSVYAFGKVTLGLCLWENILLCWPNSNAVVTQEWCTWNGCFNSVPNAVIWHLDMGFSAPHCSSYRCNSSGLISDKPEWWHWC